MSAFACWLATSRVDVFTRRTERGRWKATVAYSVTTYHLIWPAQNELALHTLVSPEVLFIKLLSFLVLDLAALRVIPLRVLLHTFN